MALRRAREDHPRSRGVYVPEDAAGDGLGGSSPLARGLLAWLGDIVSPGRIIPARAGFTAPSWDGCAPIPGGGSSPLARGLLCGDPPGIGSGGIIPARAGFTLADPWNPNEPTLYQTPAAFTADLGPAPPGRDSAVEFGAALSAAGRAGRDLAAAGLRSRFGHHPDMHRRVATTSG